MMIDLELLHRSGFTDAEQIEENIFCIPDFLPKDKIDIFFKIINGLSDDEWSKLNHLQDPEWQDKFYEYTDEKIASTIRGELEKLLSVLPGSVVYGFNRILRQRPKESMVAHADITYDKVNKLNRDYASIIYLNDDYAGGELSYVQLDIAIRPPAGSLMIFKTGNRYEHEVKTVYGDKPRYCLPAWIFSPLVDKE